jgi:MFS family permease
MSASMIAAALGDIERDVGIDSSTAQIVFSTYFLGLGFGPFLIAAWAEMGGRKHVWLFANAWYILWNAICPVGSSKALLIVGRLMAGFGASAGVTVRTLSRSLEQRTTCTSASPSNPNLIAYRADNGRHVPQ